MFDRPFLLLYSFPQFFFYFVFNIPVGDPLSEDETDKLLNRRSFKPKPLIMSMDGSNDCK